MITKSIWWLCHRFVVKFGWQIALTHIVSADAYELSWLFTKTYCIAKIVHILKQDFNKMLYCFLEHFVDSEVWNKIPFFWNFTARANQRKVSAKLSLYIGQPPYKLSFISLHHLRDRICTVFVIQSA